VGNETFRAIVECYKEDYRDAEQRCEKTVINKSITQHVLSEGMIFVEKKGNLWFPVPEKRIYRKVAQALREKTPALKALPPDSPTPTKRPCVPLFVDRSASSPLSKPTGGTAVIPPSPSMDTVLDLDLKSLDSIPAEKAAPEESVTKGDNKTTGMFESSESSEWLMDYRDTHADITITPEDAFPSTDMPPLPLPAAASNHWEDMYHHTLMGSSPAQSDVIVAPVPKQNNGFEQQPRRASSASIVSLESSVASGGDEAAGEGTDALEWEPLDRLLDFDDMDDPLSFEPLFPDLE